MSDKFSTFSNLVAPLDAADFFAEYWERRPLHLQRGDARFYHDLLTLEQARDAISYGGLRYPALQMSKQGAFLHPEAFCQDINAGDIVFTGVPDLHKVEAEYRAGATVSLPGFHRAWPPLRRLAAGVEADFRHAVHTNIYITPGGAQGFTPHYDAHEVFILQISGVKHWKIFAPPLSLPHRTQPFRPGVFPETPLLLELDMRPGDLLYLPRGFVHAAHTSAQASLHVTLGLTVYTYVELASLWLQSCKEFAPLRQALPPGFADDAEAVRETAAEFVRLIDAFRSQLAAEETVAEFFRRVREGYPGRSEFGHGFDIEARVVTESSRLRMLPADRYDIVPQGDNVLLVYDGRSLLMARRAWSMLERLSRLPDFALADVPGELAAETKLALLRHLYQQGFLSLSA